MSIQRKGKYLVFKIIIFIIACLVIYNTFYTNYCKVNEISNSTSTYSGEYTQPRKTGKNQRPNSHHGYRGQVEGLHMKESVLDDFLINTPGCSIPNYGKTMAYNEIKSNVTNCGERAVFVEMLAEDLITFKIDNYIMSKYYTKNVYTCCYRLASRSKIIGREDTQLDYTECKSFKTGTQIYLNEEIVTVKCTISKKNVFPTYVYQDAYIFVKKVMINKSKQINKNWNVLMIGIDGMSRARASSSMPGTVQHLQKHGWLDFKGFNKVGDDDYPDLMAMLTGKDDRAIDKACEFGMDKCNDLIIWSRFREAGYVTAYAEDFLNLPDTFSKYGFQTPPTDHYMRPFYHVGERLRGNFLCTKHKPSANHLLDYANDFTTTYNTNRFFGVFWLNSFSYSKVVMTKLLDNDMVRFLQNLRENETINNTIIILLSNHGVRYGINRMQKDSYYDERLPMLYIWIPHEYRALHQRKYENINLNQKHLVTPYDIYTTLAEIPEAKEKSDVKSEACPKCTSLFEVKSKYRTCSDAGVSENWCSCHSMTKVNKNANEAKKSLELAVGHIKHIAASVKTINNMTCSPLKMDRNLRSHSYKSGGKKHYVVAWRMSPGMMAFEATVVKDGMNYTILKPIHRISAYNARGNCVLNYKERPFCYCLRIAN